MSDHEESMERQENGSNVDSPRDEENGSPRETRDRGGRGSGSPARRGSRSRSGSRGKHGGRGGGRRHRSRSRERSRRGGDTAEGGGSTRRSGRGSRSASPNSDRRRHDGNREAPTISRCLGIFGLSIYTQERDLKEVFGKYGNIEDVQIVYDAQTGRSRGFCFIYFEQEQDAAEAKAACNGLDIDGRKIRVDFSITQRAHTPTPGIYMGKPTRRRYRDDRGGGSSSGGGGGGGGASASASYDRGDGYHRGGGSGGGGHHRDDYSRNDYARSDRQYASSSYDRREHHHGGHGGGYGRERSRSPYQSRGGGGGGGGYGRPRERSRSYSPRKYYY